MKTFKTLGLYMALILLFCLSCNKQNKGIQLSNNDSINKVLDTAIADTITRRSIDSTNLLSKTKTPIAKRKAAPKDTVKIYTTVDEMPSFPGGEREFSIYLGENLKFSKHILDMGLQGRFRVQFVVTETGKIENIILKKGVHPECDKEFLQFISNMPRWNPGILDGKRVSTYYTFSMFMPGYR